MLVETTRRKPGPKVRFPAQTSVQLTEQQYQYVLEVSDRRRVPLTVVIREAVDLWIAVDKQREAA